MNKELIELIDKTETGRGKILLAMVNGEFMKPDDIADLAGVSAKSCKAQLLDMNHDSGYIEMERKKIDNLYHYRLIGMKCKMSEARTIKAPRYKKDETNDVPFDAWRKVFCLMDSCCG